MNTSPLITVREAGTQHRRRQVAFVGALLWSAGLVAAGLLWLVGFIEAPFGTFTPENFSALIDALPPTASSLLIIVVGVVGAGIAWLSLLRKESPPLAVLAPIGRFRACRRAASVDARSRGCRLRCGERLPRWVPELGGRRVPVALAAIPVTIGGLAIFAGGVMFVRVFATGAFPLDENWTTVGPELLWSLWGIALAVALAEYVRRRVHIDQPA